MNKNKDIIKFLNIFLININKGLDYDTNFQKVCDELKVSNVLRNQIKDKFFYDGLDSLIFELNNLINHEMKNAKPDNFTKLRINEKIKFFVYQRIKIINDLFDKKILLKIAVKEKSFIKLNKMLFKICDEIWFLVGDKSTDFNYYSKRIILMNIYSTAFLFNLNDNSNDLVKTKNFIDKQVNLVLKFGSLKSKVKSMFIKK